MKRVLWTLLLVTALFADVAGAQDCPAKIYLANNAATADGMHGNGGYIAFQLASSVATGSGRTCTYSRPVDPNYDPFIGRNLAADEVSAAPRENNGWVVTLAGGGTRTVTCPSRIEIGPTAYYAPSGGSMTLLPDNWLVTQNNVQSLTFDTTSSKSPFTLRCNYDGYVNVTLYVPPATRTYSAASCQGLYTPNASLSARLAACPGLDDLLLWEDGAGNVFSRSGYSYPSWTRAQIARLNQFFQMMQNGQDDLGLDCPVPADNLWTSKQYNSSPGNPVRTESASQLFFTANQAFDTYAAQVAWSLYLEVNRLVPWSLLDHPASELAEFFDSRRHHTRFPARSEVYSSGYLDPSTYPSHIQEGRDFWNATSRQAAAWEAVCDPRIAYRFLSGGPDSSNGTNLLGSTELTTLKNLTWWFHNNAAHGDARDAETSAILSTPSVYLSNRLIARSDVFFNPPSQPLVIADAGCHSASNLFYDLAKGVNIPVLHVTSLDPGIYRSYPLPPVCIDYGKHSGMVYGWGSPATTLILQHTDDIYAMNQLIFPVDGNGNPVSDQAEALFAATWLTPEQLTTWGYTVTNDFSLQTFFSKYGNPLRRQFESQGVLAGYWTPGTAPKYANSNRFSWFLDGLLCGFSGGNNVMYNCEDSDPAALQDKWQAGFGQDFLQAPGGGDLTTAQSYITHLQTCAMAATGLVSPLDACNRFYGPDNAYYTQLDNRHATTYWTGPGGI